MPPEVLAHLRREAGRRLAATRDQALAAGRDPFSEYQRRARDYATWRLMRACPKRVEALVTTVAKAAGLSPPGDAAREAWAIALLGVLETLYREAASGKAQPSGQ